jgi:dTMP kinase
VSAVVAVAAAPSYSASASASAYASASASFAAAGNSNHRMASMASGAASTPIDVTSKPRGAFIVLEGVDRCGKSTQAARLVEALGAEFMRFPDRTTAIGQMINAYLAEGKDMDDRAVHLLFSANRWEAKARIESVLASGKSIVCDRYAYSGVAFSGAKPGLDLEWCATPDRGLPAPDCVVYLDLSIEQAMARGQFGAERYEKEDFQRKVAANFKVLMAKDAAGDEQAVSAADDATTAAAKGTEIRGAGGTPWHVLDASKSMDELTVEIKAIADAAVSSAAAAPVRGLWV